MHLNLEFKPLKAPKDNQPVIDRQKNDQKLDIFYDEKKKLRKKFDEMVKNMRKNEKHLNRE